MNQYTAVICIGRNIGSVAMDIGRWCLFKTIVRNSLAYSGAKVLQEPWQSQSANDQLGMWDNTVEDACTYIALMPSGKSIDLLREFLSEDALRFGQEAITLIVVSGCDHLVRAADAIKGK